MDTVTVSPKFQVVIPRRPVRPLSEARGLFPGIDTDVEREPDQALTGAGGFTISGEAQGVGGGECVTRRPSSG